jgi:hypothetical protein
MPSISVFYCPKANSLIRGTNVDLKILPNQMTEATCECPLHPGEMLSVVRYPDPPLSNLGNVEEDDDMPTYFPPVDAGTAEQPSPQFTEVFWKTVRKGLPPEQKEQALGIATTLWENVLTKADKEALLSAFASTGHVPYHHTEMERNPSRGHFRAPPLIAHSDVRRNPDQPLKLEDIDHELVEHELVLGDLLERFEVMDTEAAQQLTYNLPLVASIVGDTRYLELLVMQEQARAARAAQTSP